MLLVRFFLNEPRGKTWGHFEDMIPRLGSSYDIEIEVTSQAKADYLTDAYFALDLPVAPAIMVGDEIVTESEDVDNLKVEAYPPPSGAAGPGLKIPNSSIGKYLQSMPEHFLWIHREGGKQKMIFTPFVFQVPLAAGGLALMAFNYLHFAIPHGKGLVKLSDIPWDRLTTGEISLYLPLIGIMLVFSLINIVSTAVFLRSLMLWLSDREKVAGFMSGPPTANIGVLVPIASLSMTANVILAPLAFFIPALSSNIQAMMGPALVLFGFLLVALFSLEAKLVKIWLARPMDRSKLNFVWLIDVFAFGLVNLTGSGIATMANNQLIASVAAFASSFALGAGILLFLIKFAVLIHWQIKSATLPQDAVLPSYFIIVPITCLFGLSLYRMALFYAARFNIDTQSISFLLINFSYMTTIGWGAFSLYLLRSYFRIYFYKSEFSPTQWAIVWALVGSQVLGVYVNNHYFPAAILSAVNYISTMAAAVVYVFVFGKFYKTMKPRQSTFSPV